ncbi:MAG TPA: flavoprotein [Thermoanaerobaculia bacterium]|jgi:phosphopantothenoylcysteine synthetase/decarboxylase|nr:flavoprotein [Thermoanaerobaculia bacterium]
MRVLVGISGSIAVVGITGHLQQFLMQKEVEELRVIMTPTAAHFLSPKAIEAIIGRSVRVDLWSEPGPMIAPAELVMGIDVYVVAPASATTVARCASGSADTLVSLCYLCHKGPVVFAPAMSEEALAHPAVRRNFKQLEEFGACILETSTGYSAATKKLNRGAMCPFPAMWSRLKSLVEQAQKEKQSVS